jgi:2-epi-5-epi-valiolone synthase
MSAARGRIWTCPAWQTDRRRAAAVAVRSSINSIGIRELSIGTRETAVETAIAPVRTDTFHCDSAKSYRIALLCGLLDGGSRIIADLLADRRALLVTTPTVGRLYARRLAANLDEQGCDVALMELSCNEQNKSLEMVSRICQRAKDLALDRRGVLIGMGGGVCTDLVTMAASWIRRGISHCRIPTTLVGQIDAGIGLKGAVNFQGKKSFLGSFYPPEFVLLDPGFLRSLPAEQIRHGLSEIIKIALVRDAALFGQVERCASEFVASGFSGPELESQDALWAAAQRMLEELAANPYEDKGYRRLVDFGHTFSPLVESATQFTMSHGDAVAIDMALSAVLAEDLGLLSPAACERILATIASVGLPIYSSHLTPELAEESLREAARHRGGSPNLVLPVEVGRATFIERMDELPYALLANGVQRLVETAARSCAS